MSRLQTSNATVAVAGSDNQPGYYLRDTLESCKVFSKVYEVTVDHPLYNKLLCIEGNRKINQVNVSNLIESMTRVGFIKARPIIVVWKGDDPYIADGQHRYKSACLEKIPFTVMEYGGDIDLIIKEMNVNQRNWNLSDFTNHYLSNKKTKKTYETFVKYKQAFDTTHCILIAIFNCSTEYKHGNKPFKDGKLTFGFHNQRHIDSTIAKFNMLKNVAMNPVLEKKVFRSMNFQGAFLKAFDNKDFDFYKFLKNFSRTKHYFNKYRQTMHILEEVYRIEKKEED